MDRSYFQDMCNAILSVLQHGNAYVEPLTIYDHQRAIRALERQRMRESRVKSYYDGQNLYAVHDEETFLCHDCHENIPKKNFVHTCEVWRPGISR